MKYLSTGYANVVFNVFLINPNSMSQVDSLDINEPTLEKYLNALQAYYPSLTSNDVQIISPNAIVNNQVPLSPTLTTPVNSVSTSSANNNNSQQGGGLVSFI